MSAKTLNALPHPANSSPPETAFGYPRDFLGNRFVYLVVSSRARGLSLGVNVNPDKICNFDCVYCEVHRNIQSNDHELDVATMAAELEKTVLLVCSGHISQQPRYARLKPDLLQLRHVALSGDGEPTLAPDFAKAVQAVMHMRARRMHPFFKVVLATNGTGLDQPQVQEGLKYFTAEDEIWIKLDAGTQSFMDKINRSEAPLEKVLHNALMVGRQRPIVIQSLFAMIDGEEPPKNEIDEYIARLTELKNAGAAISLVQIYSATRPIANSGCGHMSLKSLSAIRRRIWTEAALKAEVF
jgi:wyosine [tRNA(Phe)-imidazoG37] synthetase (radical SAM superfamily)